MVRYKLAIFIIFIFFVRNIFAQNPFILLDQGGYKVEAGDMLEVRVLNENECNVQVKVNPNGLIRLMYIGMIQVGGLTIQKIEEKIKVNYTEKRIFRNPTIIAKITSYTPKFVYLSGSVNNPGPFALPNEAIAISIGELINMSGGFSPIANKSKVSVTRSFRDKNGKLVETKTFPVDVDALSKGKTHIKGQKWWVYPGDRINVTERLF